MERLARWWWGSVPAAAGRLSPAFGTVMGDGPYLNDDRRIGALAPLAALLLGIIAGWRHPLATDLYTTSLLIMSAALVVGTLSAALGVWAIVGYAIGDLLLAARSGVFVGSLAVTATTWLSLLLCYVILTLLVVLIPLTARSLAAEVAERQRLTAPHLAAAVVAVVAEAIMVFAWSQAALVLTRPYFAWHGLGAAPAAVSALHITAWLLPLVAIGAATARVVVELRLPAPQHDAAAAHGARRRLPTPFAVIWRVAIAVFILAGLFETWVDAVVVAAVIAAFVVLREPALRRFTRQTAVVMRIPVLPRLIAGAVVSAIIAVLIVSALGTASVVRPIVISTLVSLVIFTILLPDHIIREDVPEQEQLSATPAPPPLPAPAT